MGKERDLSDQELVDEYKYAVCRWHYDPINSREPKFSKDVLEEEVLRRMNREHEQEKETEDY